MGVIRITDTGFNEQVLFDQDAVVTEIMQLPEFQHRMTTTERNYLLGKHYAARERALGVAPGLLATCAERLESDWLSRTRQVILYFLPSPQTRPSFQTFLLNQSVCQLPAAPNAAMAPVKGIT